MPCKLEKVYAFFIIVDVDIMLSALRSVNSAKAESREVLRCGSWESDGKLSQDREGHHRNIWFVAS